MSDSFSTPEELASDEAFIRWVRQPDAALQARWEAWQARQPGREPLVAQARQLVRAVHFQPHEPTAEQVETIWQRIAATHAAARPAGSRPARVAPLRTWRTWRQVAAGTALLVLALAAAWLLMPGRPAYHATGAGETREITLPDGSRVHLNARSSLRLADDWAEGRPRRVLLTGEAFFSVRKQVRAGTRIPFTVEAGEVRVEVLGTEFNVSSRPRKTRVALQSGSIRLHVARAAARQVLLKPGDLFEYTPATQAATTRRVPLAPYTAWKDRKLVLQNTPLREVARILEETYGQPVVIRDEATAALRLNGTFPLGDKQKLLDALAVTAEISILIQDGRIVMEP